MSGTKYEELDRILGFDHQITLLAARFLNDRAKRLVVRGPSGVGKTTLAQSMVRNRELCQKPPYWSQPIVIQHWQLRMPEAANACDLIRVL